MLPNKHHVAARSGSWDVPPLRGGPPYTLGVEADALLFGYASVSDTQATRQSDAPPQGVRLRSDQDYPGHLRSPDCLENHDHLAHAVRYTPKRIN